jgi:hypothetical protein
MSRTSTWLELFPQETEKEGEIPAPLSVEWPFGFRLLQQQAFARWN